jgi:hypothetical protein
MRNQPPIPFANLRAERLWSIEWAQDTFPGEDLRYVVCLKLAEGSYENHGTEHTASEAFALRRQLVAETGITNYFIRATKAKQRRIEADGDDDAALDYFRDRFNEGVGVADIPRHLRKDYLTFCRTRGRSAR